MGFDFGSLSSGSVSNIIPTELPSSIKDLYGGSQRNGGSYSRSYSLCCGLRGDQYGNSNFGIDTGGFFGMLGRSLDDLLNMGLGLDTSAAGMWMNQLTSMGERMAAIRQLTPIYVQIYQILEAGAATPTTQKQACTQVEQLASQGQGITGYPEDGIGLDNFEMYEHARHMAILKDTSSELSKETVGMIVSTCYAALRNYARGLVTKTNALAGALGALFSGIESVIGFITPIVSKITDVISGSLSSLMGLPNGFFSSVGDRFGLGGLDEKINSLLSGAFDELSSFAGRLDSLKNCAAPF